MSAGFFRLTAESEKIMKNNNAVSISDDFFFDQ